MATEDTRRQFAAEKALDWAGLAHVHMSDAFENDTRAQKLADILHANREYAQFRRNAENCEKDARRCRDMATMWAAVAAVQPATT